MLDDLLPDSDLNSEISDNSSVKRVTNKLALFQESVATEAATKAATEATTTVTTSVDNLSSGIVNAVSEVSEVAKLATTEVSDAAAVVSSSADAVSTAADSLESAARDDSKDKESGGAQSDEVEKT